MKLNCCGFSAAYKQPLHWNKHYLQQQFVLLRPKIPMLILLFCLLGTSLWWNLFPPPFKASWRYGERWKQNSLLISRQKKFLKALTAQKWESGRPQPVPNCFPEFLFIACCSRTHFWVTYLKFTQQNIWEKRGVKSLQAMWMTNTKAQKNKFFSLEEREKDFLILFF